MRILRIAILRILKNYLYIYHYLYLYIYRYLFLYLILMFIFTFNFIFIVYSVSFSSSLSLSLSLSLSTPLPTQPPTNDAKTRALPSAPPNFTAGGNHEALYLISMNMDAAMGDPHDYVLRDTERQRTLLWKTCVFQKVRRTSGNAATAAAMRRPLKAKALVLKWRKPPLSPRPRMQRPCLWRLSWPRDACCDAHPAWGPPRPRSTSYQRPGRSAPL